MTQIIRNKIKNIKETIKDIKYDLKIAEKEENHEQYKFYEGLLDGLDYGLQELIKARDELEKVI